MLDTVLALAVAFGVNVFGPPVVAEAQTPKVPRIGVLLQGTASVHTKDIAAFREGLKGLGYVDGQNIAIEYRFGEFERDRLPGLAAELVRLKVDVIVAGGGGAVQPAKDATGTIPIVMTAVSDPVAGGYVASLRRPGGNVTGSATLGSELGGKRVQLLKEAMPRLSRIAVLGRPDAAAYGAQMKEIETAARALGLQVQRVALRTPDDLEGAFAAMRKDRAGAVLSLSSPTFAASMERIAELAIQNRLPAMYLDADFARAGGLMAYGPSRPAQYRQAAMFVDKILKGAKPAVTPVEQPTKLELVINLKTARALGLVIPQSLLLRADERIE